MNCKVPIRRELVFVLIAVTLILERTFHTLVILTIGNDTTTTIFSSANNTLTNKRFGDLGHLPQPPTRVVVSPVPNSLSNQLHRDTNPTTIFATKTSPEEATIADANPEVQASSSSSSSPSLDLTIRVPDHYEYLLNVPFYIYEEWGSPSYPNATLTFGGKPINMNTLDPEKHIHGINEIKSKHADDLYLVAAAINHPMRTMDPSQAKLFLVPTPFNMLIDAIDHKLRGDMLCFLYNYNISLSNNNNNGDNNNNSSNSTDRLCNQDFIRYVDNGLANSQWYLRYKGYDHIAILSHWRWKGFRIGRFGGNRWKPKRIFKCNLIDFEGKVQKFLRRTKRIAFPSYYVGKRCPTSKSTSTKAQQGSMMAIQTQQQLKKTQDFSMIATLIPKSRHPKVIFQDRINVCNWIQNQTQSSQNKVSNSDYMYYPYKMKACGLGIQCPALSESKFVIHAMGDTEGSNRPMDGLLSHTIPIFTRQSQYNVLPTWIDWNQISYFADVSKNQSIFMNDLYHIITDETTYQVKQQNVIQNTDLFDYDTIVPLDTYMYMFQVTLFPETKRINVTSPYSALLLP